MAEQDRGKEILEKPLPTILEELQEDINRVEGIAMQVQKALALAEQAASEAKESGEKAAGAARIAADQAVAKVREDFSRQISELKAEISLLREEVTNESLGTYEGLQAAARTKAAKSRLIKVE